MMPPETKRETKPMAKSMAVVKRILPPHKVPSQLKVLIADGTPMARVRMENTRAEKGLKPLTNMW